MFDNRDQALEERLHGLENLFTLFRCPSIGNCAGVCPKGLNPMVAMGRLRREMLTIPKSSYSEGSASMCRHL